jgi:hypothetical protein
VRRKERRSDAGKGMGFCSRHRSHQSLLVGGAMAGKGRRRRWGGALWFSIRQRDQTRPCLILNLTTPHLKYPHFQLRVGGGETSRAAKNSKEMTTARMKTFESTRFATTTCRATKEINPPHSSQQSLLKGSLSPVMSLLFGTNFAGQTLYYY